MSKKTRSTIIHKSTTVIPEKKIPVSSYTRTIPAKKVTTTVRKTVTKQKK
jgi:hypothetical protein